MFLDALNEYLIRSLASVPQIEYDELSSHRALRKTELAARILRKRASLNFNKVDFANIVASRIEDAAKIPLELSLILETIEKTLLERRKIRKMNPNSAPLQNTEAKKEKKSKAAQIAGIASTVLWILGFVLTFTVPAGNPFVWLGDALLLIGFWHSLVGLAPRFGLGLSSVS